MPKEFLDKAVLASSCFVSNEEKEIFLEVSTFPEDELGDVLVRLNGVRKDPIEQVQQKKTFFLGETSSVKGKELIVDSFVQDEIDNNTDETAIEVSLTGLLNDYDKVLNVKASPNGSKVIYRVEIKFF